MAVKTAVRSRCAASSRAFLSASRCASSARARAPSRAISFSSSQSRFFGGFDVDGNREIHIQHHSLHQRAKALADVFRPPPLAPEREALLPRIVQDGFDEVLNDNRISTNVPARFKPDARMSLADLANIGEILIIEPCRAYRLPVGDLGTLRGIHLRRILEEFARLRCLLDGAIELLEDGRKFLVDDVFDAAYARALIAIKPNECEAFIQCGVARSVYHCHVVPCIRIHAPSARCTASRRRIAWSLSISHRSWNY